MIIGPGLCLDADFTVALKQGEIDPSVQADVVKKTQGFDTVSLSTSSLSASETRSFKVAQLRDSIESGSYKVSAAALAGSMIEKAETGSAPELSFLTRNYQDDSPQ